MKEYIEREAVIQLIKTEGSDGDYNLGAKADNEWFCAEAKRIPAADVVEVRHGRWNNGYEVQNCSECGYRGKRSYHYCPHCGAKMTEV